MEWLSQVLSSVAAFLDQHGLISAFALLLLEESGVPLPVPLLVTVQAHVTPVSCDGITSVKVTLRPSEERI